MRGTRKSEKGSGEMVKFDNIQLIDNSDKGSGNTYS